MRVKLTAKSVEHLDTKGKRRADYWDTALPGFGLRITENGKKSWVLMYRSRGRQRRMTLGRYPAFSLSDAREEARKALHSIEVGNDPAEEKLAAKRKVDMTFAEVIERFIELYAKPKNRSWAETHRLLVKNVAPAIGHLGLEEITRHHIIDILDQIGTRGARTQSNRVLAAVRKLFNWALDRGMIDHSPVLGIKPPSKEASRDRVLTDQEIRKVWSVWNGLNWPFGPLFKLLLITGQRRNEIANMRWSDLDFERQIWTIPREIAKNDRSHDVPLSPLAMDVIDQLPHMGNSNFIFSTNGINPVSGFSKPKRITDEISEVTDWRLHDLRRTVATGMARLNVSPHVVEKILNHSSGIISGVAAVYNRYGYEDEKLTAMTRWSDRLNEIIAGALLSGAQENTTELSQSKRNRSDRRTVEIWKNMDGPRAH